MPIIGSYQPVSLSVLNSLKKSLRRRGFFIMKTDTKPTMYLSVGSRLSNQKSHPLLVTFQDYLRVEKGLSESSIFSYGYDLKKFQKFIERENKNFLNVKTQDVASFIKEQSSKSMSPRSVARALATLRHFYKHLKDDEQIEENPAEKVESPEIQKNLPEYLTIDEIEELFQCIHEDDVYELRDKAMFELMYSSGLRISEACSLRLSDVDMENRYINIHGKGGRERLVPFGEKSFDILKKYIGTSRKNILKSRDSAYVFISKKSKYLNRKSAWRLLKKYLSRTKITKAVTPHTFRHSFATHLIENNADLRSVQQLLGHIDISTTQIYTHLANKTLKAVHEKHHPRS